MLTKKFLKENPVEDMSAQSFFYNILFYNELEELAEEYSRAYINRADDETELLKQETSPEVLLKMMRGN